MRMTFRQALEALVLSGNNLRIMTATELEWLMLSATLTLTPLVNMRPTRSYHDTRPSA